MPLIFSEATQLKFDLRVLSLSYTSSSENTHYHQASYKHFTKIGLLL